MNTGTKKSIVQFVKFALVGALNTLVDFAVFYIFTNFVGLNTVFAKMISYTCGVLNSYLFNSMWTFKEEHRKTKKEFLLFFCVNLISYAVSISVMHAAIYIVFANGALAAKLYGTFLGQFVKNAVKMNEMIGNLFAIPASIIVNFALNKLLVFKTPKDAEAATCEKADLERSTESAVTDDK